MDDNNLSANLKLIRESPQRARALVVAWQSFVVEFGRSLPDIYGVETREEWLEWIKLHNFQGSEKLWTGKEVSDAYFYANEDNQIKTEGGIDVINVPNELSGLPVGVLAMIFRKKNRILELDDNYLKLAKKHEANWLKEHGVDEKSNEWIKYKYNDWDSRDPSEFEKRIEVEFRQKFPKRATFYDKQKKAVYKKLSEDPYVQYLNLKISEETKARSSLAKNSNPDISDRMLKSIQKGIQLKHWERFAEEYPEKTQTYKNREGADYSTVKQAYNNLLQRQKMQIPKTSFQLPPTQQTISRPSITMTIPPSQRVSIPSFPAGIGGQMGRMAGSLGRGALSSTRLIGFATIGWPLAIVLIVVGVVVFIMLMSTAANSGETTQANQQSQQQINQIQNINGFFVITNGTSEDQNLINGFIQEASLQLNFQKLFGSGGPINISFGTDSDLPKGLCSGSVNNTNIRFYNFPISACGPNDKKYLFFHELGHVIGNLNQTEIYNPFKQAFSGSVNNPQPSLVEQDNQYPHSCYSSSGFLKSYEYAGEYGSIAGRVDESFAESVADSLLKTRLPWFNNFPTDCPATYNWIHSHVLTAQ